VRAVFDAVQLPFAQCIKILAVYVRLISQYEFGVWCLCDWYSLGASYLRTMIKQSSDYFS
jgi:hypothetical protein